MGYVRMDDAHENGRLSQFRARLSGEVRMQTGESFEIFQDRNDIKWGKIILVKHIYIHHNHK